MNAHIFKHDAARPGGLRATTGRLPRSVRRARAALPGAETLASLGEFFKLVGDPTRLGILHALAPGEMCVQDLGAALGMSESATSHQLALLRRARMVKARRSGQSVFYGLCDQHVRKMVEAARVHLAEEVDHRAP